MLKPLIAAAVLLFAPITLATQPRQPVTVSVKAAKTRVAPGETVPIAVVLDHQPGWHSQTNAPVLPPELADLQPVATAVNVKVPVGASVGATQWPPVHRATVRFGTRPVSYGVFEGRAIAYVPVTVSESAAPGSDLRIGIAVDWQACNETTCAAPESLEDNLTLTVVPKGSAGPARLSDPDFSGFKADSAQAPRAPTGPTGPPGTGPTTLAPPARGSSPVNIFGYQVSAASWLIWPLAFLAGLLMNVTPCVLPVLPLVVGSLQMRAGNRARLVAFGSAFCAGIVAFFGVASILVGVFGQAWGQLNGYWWFNIPLGLIVAALGLSMMGLFALRLPQRVYAINPSGETTGGNFLLGVLAAVVSTPCGGPVLAAVLAWAATQPTIVGVLAVLVMGVGMAFPFAVLIFIPGLVERLPRTGPTSELIKQVLGLVVVAVAVYILAYLTPATWTYWFVGLFVGAAFVWLYIGGLRILKSTNAKIVVSHIALLGLIGTVMVTQSLASPGGATGGTADGPAVAWKTFYGPGDGPLSDEINKSLADGKVVVVDFTAKWCAKCLELEHTTLRNPGAVSVLTAPNVVPTKVNLTSASYKDGWAVLRELSGAGNLPFLAVMGPARGRDRPVTFAGVFTESELEAAVRAAAGGGMAAAGGRP